MRRLDRTKKTKKNYLAEHPPWIVTNIAFSYEGELQTNRDAEKKHYFLLGWIQD